MVIFITTFLFHTYLSKNELFPHIILLRKIQENIYDDWIQGERLMLVLFFIPPETEHL